MKIESMDDLRFLSEILFNGWDTYSPRVSLIQATAGRIKDLIEELVNLDPNNTALYLEKGPLFDKELVDPKERPQYLLWKIQAWNAREGRKERLHQEVLELHRTGQVTRAKIAILTTKIRRVLKLGPTEKSDFPNMVASQAITTNNKDLVIAIGVPANELEFWDEDI